jgi:alpha-L-arabinofuranosidase
MILVDDDITAHNTFDNPNRIQQSIYNGATINADHNLKIELPAASVVALTLR